MFDITMTIQIIGWLASISAVGSYALKNITHVRVLNCIASALFMIYGFIIGAPAIVIMNATLVAIHIAYIGSHNRFGELIAVHKKTTIALFAFYALVSIVWVCLKTGFDTTEVIGICSSVGFVAGFLIPNERPMRIVCSSAIVLNIVYAVMLMSPQIAFTNCVSLFMNVFHLIRKSDFGARNVYSNKPQRANTQ